MQNSFSLMPYYSFRSPIMKTSQGKPSRIMSIHSSAKWRAHFETSKATTKLIVIEFTASWCVPCRAMEPFIEELAAKCTDVEFIKIDVDELMGVASQFRVQTMPTFVLMKKGFVVDKVTGVKNSRRRLTSIELLIVKTQ